jgi:hypothetical protein
MIDQQGYDILN